MEEEGEKDEEDDEEDEEKEEENEEDEEEEEDDEEDGEEEGEGAGGEGPPRPSYSCDVVGQPPELAKARRLQLADASLHDNTFAGHSCVTLLRDTLT